MHTDPTLQRITQSLALEIHKLGFLPGDLFMPVSAMTGVDSVTDPYTGAGNRRIELRDGAGKKMGQIQFNSDDSFFAEFDVVRPHPKDPRWFVEGVVAWGRGDTVKSEAKLLPMP
ncbi:hypothetical protein [Methylogaea oryzae]|uniref:Uncharacterized protein n=2 Tax=Methylogaea oryzae TaxID=1295382 RepID=A0A8D4VQ90_9GAMM|nr:hypothetical protein [Methylogaea oryzae]BBL72063.1 hypothetical protein MoryE10_26690 [Methylogaea oryzae]